MLPLDLTDPGMHRAVAESCRDLKVGLLAYPAGSVKRTLDFTDDPYEASLRQVQLNWIGHLGPAPRDRRAYGLTAGRWSR